MKAFNDCFSSDRRVLLTVLILAALTQTMVAMRHSVEDLSSPNAATPIGHSLAERHVFEGGWWARLRGPEATNDPGEPRMFHLPGEPLYTAGGLIVLPKSFWRFIHVPVTTLLIGCAAWWGIKLGGRVMGLLTGLIGMFHPFVLLHGVVWDDTFLGAALDWLGAAIVLGVLMHPGRKMRWPTWIVLCVVTGYTAITRAASQLVFVLLAGTLLMFRTLPPARMLGIAMLLGMAVSVGAWGLRNRVVSGEFFAGSTHDGITLWESVYPSAIEALVKTGAPERMNNQRMLDDFARTRHMSELKANTYFLQRARSYILSHPWEMIRTGFIKLGDDLSGWSFDEPAGGARNITSVVSNSLMILLALPALWRGRMWRDCQKPVRMWFVAVLIAQGGTTLFLLFVGPTSLRYWMSVQPVLWMGDAWTVIRLLGRGTIPQLRRGVALDEGSDSVG
jgi:hypothetical protein